MRKAESIARVPIDLGARSYDILIGEGLLQDAGSLLKPYFPMGKAVIVSDEKVARLHLKTLVKALAAEGIESRPILVPEGEKSKSFDQLAKLCDALLEEGVERRSTIIALGGGVVGDLTGFVASILRRGVDFIQIPTTLLAQVDSSVGGKTGINSRLGKNLIGAFHQPRMVLIDVSLLSTLSARDLRAGYAEVVKYGLIDQPDMFDWLEQNGSALLAGDMALTVEAVKRSCTAKARIVAADEREGGVRALLNLGHTFGHALEAQGGYDGRLLHGEAVAIGCLMAFHTSLSLGECVAEDVERLRTHLQAVGLPTHPKHCGITDLTADIMLQHMAQDKKVAAGKLTLVLAKGIGRSYLTNTITRAQLYNAIDGFLAAV